MNPAEWLSRTATRWPGRSALFKGMTCDADYGTFAARAAGIGAALAARGIGRGDQVALFMANRTEYLEALYGTWWAGAAAVPINGKLHPREAAWIIEDAEVALVFADDKGASALGDLTSGPLISTEGDAFREMRETVSSGGPASLAQGDMAWLFYTSGTTGRPKGVMISCGNIIAMTMSYFADVDEVQAEDAILYAAPMSHGAGLYNFMHVLRGARHVVPDSGGFDAAEILRIAPDIGPVSMFAAPTMVRRLVDVAKAAGQTGEGLRTVVYAGGPMYEADILEAVQQMGPRFVQIYGQGECPMGITALPRADVADRDTPGWRERLNSVGRAQSLVEVAILDSEGADLPVGEVGEIAVRGATVMPGYWRNSQATAKTLRDGWLWTGDMGRMDGEGYVTLHDRSKDMIISGGSNIYPREVEEVLLSHPLVNEVAVVGQQDPEWGEVVVAFVVCQPGHALDAVELDALCLDRIARFKRPKTYHFAEELPKNNYGKVLKTELRERLANKEG
ncbi:long-chain acyl-CoA synthetase [Mameliella alba]|uniref:AMP-binding protein n=1 Tax=Mameliella alba TaxID=561184 RepID=UPI00087FF9FC|nr:AMP-binding protein [Mameliella alba]OWV48698.1 AMP-dependent synthetase [Mameliella alba]PTR39262.1 long-chain acyl-CoA synthetase [Mameliella alba]GGF64489.1 AMP-dependent synthetase [Mameliella alba]SDD28616.1 long-chain acyl-CoA synthetase [Mameliella alba]